MFFISFVHKNQYKLFDSVSLIILRKTLLII